MMVQRELAYTDCIRLSLNGCALSIHHVLGPVPVQLETQEMAMPSVYLVTKSDTRTHVWRNLAVSCSDGVHGLTSLFPFYNILGPGTKEL